MAPLQQKQKLHFQLVNLDRRGVVNLLRRDLVNLDRRSLVSLNRRRVVNYTGFSIDLAKLLNSNSNFI